MTGDRQSLLFFRIGPAALAAAVFLWSAYDSTRHLLPSWLYEYSVTAAGGGIQAGEPASDLNYSVPTIIHAHLFGVASSPADPDVVEAPETKLRINLMGLVASANSNLARAVIAVDGSKAKAYSVGQSIEGTDASVHAVEAGRVLLKRSQAIESLSLKREEIGNLSDATPVTMNSTNNAISAPSQPRESIQGNPIRERASNTKMNQAF